MAHVLEMLQLAQDNGVAQVNIGRGGIDAEIDAQRLAGLRGLLELGAQILFANDFRGAFAEIGELFVDGFMARFRHDFSPLRAFAKMITRRPSMRYRPSRTMRTASE